MLGWTILPRSPQFPLQGINITRGPLLVGKMSSFINLTPADIETLYYTPAMSDKSPVDVPLHGTWNTPVTSSVLLPLSPSRLEDQATFVEVLNRRRWVDMSLRQRTRACGQVVVLWLMTINIWLLSCVFDCNGR